MFAPEPEEAAQAPPIRSGNFKDLEGLLAQLEAPPLIELGKPMPSAQHLPKPRSVGRCEASHNLALFGSGKA